jgi:hypothetical protein
MSDLAAFLDHLFSTGEARLTDRPEADDPRRIQAVLREAFREYRLEVAGPMIEFDAEAAGVAAVFTARACWFAVSRDEPPDVVAAALKRLVPPRSASAHLSVDLTLRYAVTVHRRVHAQIPEDVLAVRLEEVLGTCPLTGVLSDIAGAPTGDLTFAEHAGLELLYAERLAARFRPAWLPSAGRTRQAVEWVYQQLGRTVPLDGSPASRSA